MQDSTVAVLLVVAIYIEHQRELLDCRSQVYGLLLAPTKLEPYEVAFAKRPVIVERIARVFARKRSRMDTQLEDLLSQVVEQHVAQVLHLFLDVALPFETLGLRLGQNIQLDEVLVASEKP